MKTLRTIYKVNITKVETVETTGREYQKISDTGNEEDNKSVYAYVSCIKEKEIYTDIFIQECEEIDISAIIKAVNKL